MDDNPKRSVNKRQAAMDSEKKWKEAFDADMMYELSLPLRTLKSDDPLSLSSPTIPEPNEELTLDAKDGYTVMRNSVLYELVACLVCPSCMARDLKLEIGKNDGGFMQNIEVCCTHCHHEVFCRGIDPISYQFRSPQVVSLENGPFTSESEEPHKNAEILVCDVDVPDNPFSPCSMNGTYSNQGSSISDSYEETPVKTVVTPSKSDTASKPLRPCVFCSKMQARLRQHVKTAHWNHPFVSNMSRQPPRVQAKLMRQLRSEGILAENKRRLKSGRNDLLRVRNQGSGELTVCSICGGYYKKNVLWRHKATCTGRPQLSVAENDTEPDKDFVTPGPRLVKGELDLSNWASPPVANGSSTDNDVSEIDKIKEILDGINHGVFSQSVTESTPTMNHTQMDGSQNGVLSGLQHAIFSSQPATPQGDNQEFATNDADGGDFVANASEKDDFDAQTREIAGFIASLVKPELRDDTNEDQLLFDSLPAIINGRESSVRTSWSDSTEDDGQVDWQDMKSDTFPDSDLLPCYATYQSKRRKRSRSDFQYQFWKKEHEDRIRGYFSTMVDALKVPGKEACQEFLNNNADINTDWVRVKYKVYNEIQKKKKRIKRSGSPSPSVQQDSV